MAQDIWSLSRRGDNERLKRVLGPPSEDWSMRTISLDPVANKKGAKLRGARMQERVRWVRGCYSHVVDKSEISPFHQPRPIPSSILRSRPFLMSGLLSLQSGATALHRAAANGHLETCKMLVDQYGKPTISACEEASFG